MDRIRVVKQPPSLSPLLPTLRPGPHHDGVAICKLTSYGRRRAGKGRVTRPTVIDQSLPNRGHHQPQGISAASRGSGEPSVRSGDSGGTRDLASVHSHIRNGHAHCTPSRPPFLPDMPTHTCCCQIIGVAAHGDGHATYRLHGRAANHSSTLDKRLAGNIQMSFLTSPDITKEVQAHVSSSTRQREQRMTPDSVLDRESRPRPTTSGLFDAAGLGGKGRESPKASICWEAKHE